MKLVIVQLIKETSNIETVLVALIPIGYRSIPNDRTITDLLDGGYRSSTDIVIPHPNNYYLLDGGVAISVIGPNDWMKMSHVVAIFTNQ